jgi:hypothetical protein
LFTKTESVAGDSIALASLRNFVGGGDAGHNRAEKLVFEVLKLGIYRH